MWFTRRKKIYYIVYGTLPRSNRRLKLQYLLDLDKAEKFVDAHLKNYSSMEIMRPETLLYPYYYKEYVNEKPPIDLFIYKAPRKVTKTRKGAFKSEVVDRRDGKTYITMKFYSRIVIATIDTEDEEKVLQAMPETRPYWQAKYNKKGQFICLVFYSRYYCCSLQSAIFGYYEKRKIIFKDGNNFNFCKSNLFVVGRDKKEKVPKTAKVSESKKSKIPYKGVYHSKDNNSKRPPYIALIKFAGKMYNLGRYHNMEEAAKAYDKKALELVGPSAKINFPDEIHFETSGSEEVFNNEK